jgi:hypothetical protein
LVPFFTPAAASLFILKKGKRQMSHAIATDAGLAWQTGPIRPRACTCGSVVCQLLHERVMSDMSRRMFVGGVAAMMAPFVALHAAETGAAGRQAGRPPRVADQSAPV